MGYYSIVVCYGVVSVRISGVDSVVDPGGPGGPPSYFSTKMRPEGPKKIFLRPPPPPLSQGLDDRPPPPLI